MSDRSSNWGNWIALLGLIVAVFALLGGKEWVESHGWTLNPYAESPAAEAAVDDEPVTETETPTSEVATAEDFNTEAAKDGADSFGWEWSRAGTGNRLSQGFWGAKEFGAVVWWEWFLAVLASLACGTTGFMIGEVAEWGSATDEDELVPLGIALVLAITGTLLLDARGFPWIWASFIVTAVIGFVFNRWINN